MPGIDHRLAVGDESEVAPGVQEGIVQGGHLAPPHLLAGAHQVEGDLGSVAPHRGVGLAEADTNPPDPWLARPLATVGVPSDSCPSMGIGDDGAVPQAECRDMRSAGHRNLRQEVGRDDSPGPEARQEGSMRPGLHLQVAVVLAGLDALVVDAAVEAVVVIVQASGRTAGMWG